MRRISAISAVLIVRNEEKALDDCLASLADFTEVIVYLNGCTDASEAVARRHANVKVMDGEFLGFSATRNAAAQHASNDWIFAIDADERATPRLIDNLLDWDTEASKAVGWPLTITIYMGTRLRLGSGKPYRRARLYNRTLARWDKLVHEVLVGDGLVRVDQDGEVHHHEPSHDCMREKTRHYGQLHRAGGVKARSQLKARAGAVVHFIKFYLLKGGFVHGRAGFSKAWLSACWHYEKYNDRIRPS